MNQKKNYTELRVCIFLLLFLIIALFPATRKIGIDRDSYAYQNDVLRAIQNNFKNSITSSREPTFFLITYISSLIFSDAVRGVLIIYALLAIALKLLSMYKYSEDIFISLCVYFALFYILHEFTTIRAGVASGIFLLSYDDIIKKRLKKYVFKVFIATLFHYSAFVLIICIDLRA